MARLFTLLCVFGLLLSVFVPATLAQRDDDDDDDNNDDEETQGGRVQESDNDDEDDEDDDEEYGDDDETMGALDGVTLTPLFVNHQDKRIPSGDRVDIIYGFTNEGTTELNVTAAAAYLVAPQDYLYFIENYTAIAYGRIVAPGEQHTFQYAFQPNENFEPREFGLTVVVEYNDPSGRTYVSAVYNGTIDIVEPRDFTDSTTFFTYCAIAAVASLGAFVAYRLSAGGKKGKSHRSRPIETGTSDKKMTENEMEYLKGIIPSEPKEKKKSTGKAASGKAASSKASGNKKSGKKA